MFTKSFMSVASIFIGISGAANAQTCVTYDTGIRPYSSSYLPVVDPVFFTPKEAHLSDTETAGLDKKTLKELKGLSTMSRLDLLNLKVLKKKTDYQKTMKEFFHLPNLPGWMGLCNQWSGNSLNPNINRLLKLVEGGLQCKGTVITGGEIEELFTGMYRIYEKKGSFSGAIIKESLKEEMRTYIEYTGQDTYPAHRFSEDLSSNLKKGVGVVLNKSKSGSVWNYPVYKDKICTQRKELDSLASLPLSVIETKSTLLNQILAQVITIDSLQINLIPKPDFGAEGNLEVEKLYEKVLSVLEKEESLNAIRDQLEENEVEISDEAWEEVVNSVSLESLQSQGSGHFPKILAYRRAIADLVKKIDLLGAIKLKEGITVFQERHEITYGVEGSYGTTGDHVNNSDTYDILIFKNSSGQIVDSQWETSAYSRPAHIVIPEMSDTSILEPLQDLFAIIKECKQDPILDDAIERLLNHRF